MKKLGSFLEELPETIGKGQRQTTIFDLCVNLLYEGYPEATVKKVAHSVNKSSCVPPKTHNCISRCVDEAVKFHAAGKKLTGVRR